MSSSSRPIRDVPPVDSAKNIDFFETSAILYRKGVERIAELQSRYIECAVQQNKEAIELCRQTVEKLPWASYMNVFDDAAGTLERFAEAQKTAINLTVDQTRAFVEMVKERTATASKSADSISKFAQQSFERSVTAQKKVAEATVSETKSAFENARERFAGPATEAVTESIQRTVDTVINAQKELLETARSRRAPAPEKVAAL
jgi:dGTP triphosphohydrolase